MAKTSLQEMMSVLDPQKTFNWELVLPNIPGLADTRQLTFKCISTEIPDSNVEQVSWEGHGVKLHFSGRRTWTGTWTATFVEDRLNSTRSAFVNWLELIRSWDNNSGSYKSQYAVPGEITMYDDTNTAIRAIKVINIWPTGIGAPTLDQTADIVKYTITFSFDMTREVTNPSG